MAETHAPHGVALFIGETRQQAPSSKDSIPLIQGLKMAETFTPYTVARFTVETGQRTPPRKAFRPLK